MINWSAQFKTGAYGSDHPLTHMHTHSRYATARWLTVDLFVNHSTDYKLVGRVNKPAWLESGLARVLDGLALRGQRSLINRLHM